jgi:hypothetical protein
MGKRPSSAVQARQTLAHGSTAIAETDLTLSYAAVNVGNAPACPDRDPKLVGMMSRDYPIERPSEATAFDEFLFG